MFRNQTSFFQRLTVRSSSRKKAALIILLRIEAPTVGGLLADIVVKCPVMSGNTCCF